MTSTPISNAYRSAIITAIVLQLLLGGLMSIMLDGGVLAAIGGYSMVGFWIGAVIVILRRPREPQRSDLTYIRWGYVAILIVGIVISIVVTSLRHKS